MPLDVKYIFMFEALQKIHLGWYKLMKPSFVNLYSGAVAVNGAGKHEGTG